MQNYSKTDLLEALLEELWSQYSSRVDYAKIYSNEIKKRNGVLANDHIALRSFMCNNELKVIGIKLLSNIFTKLGYKAVDCYSFPSKSLNATHYEHSKGKYPKIFISELDVSKLSKPIKDIVLKYQKSFDDKFYTQYNFMLNRIGSVEILDETAFKELVEILVSFFNRHWETPLKSDVFKVDDESQYAAWTLIHGYSVNHFTAYINEQQVKEWPDIEHTLAALESIGVPMKEVIEGEKGSKLRQSSTQAVKEDVEVINDNGELEKIEWTYAYYEFAERNFIEVNGKKMLFNGFLGEQATNLFDVTTYKK
jgi:hypothetical protein